MVLEPIIVATSYRYTCGSFPKRGSHYGKRAIEKWIRSEKGIKYFAKIDIRHFYDNIRIEVLMHELSIRIKDNWFLYIIRICLSGFRKGIPLGFYISQWLANYILEPLDKFITETMGIEKDVRYVDDMVFFANAKKKLHMAVVKIRQFIGRRFRLKLKRNYQVCRFDYEKNGKTTGRPLDFMGFVFYRNKTTIRKSIMLSATRLARKMHKAKEQGRRYRRKDLQAILSYMGWFDCTNAYQCYLDHIKPYVNIGKCKQIVSKLDRREKKNETVERGKMFRAA
jgi:hypothetical protein